MFDPRNPAALGAFLRGDLENAVRASTPGGIEAQEAEGQQTFCATDTLPVDIEGVSKEDLEALGFILGDKIDSLFMRAKLPAGWKKVATGHSMWSDIVDDSGQKRFAVFYKAAFYDQRAFMRPA